MDITNIHRQRLLAKLMSNRPSKKTSLKIPHNHPLANDVFDSYGDPGLGVAVAGSIAGSETANLMGANKQNTTPYLSNVQTSSSQQFPYAQTATPEAYNQAVGLIQQGLSQSYGTLANANTQARADFAPYISSGAGAMDSLMDSMGIARPSAGSQAAAQSRANTQVSVNDLANQSKLAQQNSLNTYNAQKNAYDSYMRAAPANQYNAAGQWDDQNPDGSEKAYRDYMYSPNTPQNPGANAPVPTSPIYTNNVYQSSTDPAYIAAQQAYTAQQQQAQAYQDATKAYSDTGWKAYNDYQTNAPKNQYVNGVWTDPTHTDWSEKNYRDYIYNPNQPTKPDGTPLTSPTDPFANTAMLGDPNKQLLSPDATAMTNPQQAQTDWYNNLASQPDFQWNLNQGQANINAQMSALGLAGSGNQTQSLTDYVRGQQVNQAATARQNLLAIAGLGQTAASNLTSQSTTPTATQQSNLQSNTANLLGQMAIAQNPSWVISPNPSSTSTSFGGTAAQGHVINGSSVNPTLTGL